MILGLDDNIQKIATKSTISRNDVFGVDRLLRRFTPRNDGIGKQITRAFGFFFKHKKTLAECEGFF